MSDPGDQTSARKTLKLKAELKRRPGGANGSGSRIPEGDSRAPPRRPAPEDWAAEHRRRMQADMDVLSRPRRK